MNQKRRRMSSLSLRIKDQTIQKLEKVERITGDTRSEIIRHAIERYLKEFAIK